jgi:NAD(P)-dependent dehydrogenase (short-subunit alcohol dehydrogenase family)
MARRCAPTVESSEQNTRISGATPEVSYEKTQVMKQIIVITGASSGFGALAARALAQAGHTVYAGMRETTGRNAPQVAEVARYAAERGVDLRTVELDVASSKSVKAAITKIIGESGRLDVVVHNAGQMSATEATPPG